MWDWLGQLGYQHANTTYLALLGGAAPPSPPTIRQLAPSCGPEVGATVVAITGTGFNTESSVYFGPVAGADVTYNSETSMTATAPAGVGIVEVTVTNQPMGPSAPMAFAYPCPPGPPRVTGLSPNKGPIVTHTTVIITGSGFTSTSKVAFGGHDAHRGGRRKWSTDFCGDPAVDE